MTWNIEIHLSHLSSIEITAGENMGKIERGTLFNSRHAHPLGCQETDSGRDV